MKFETEYSTDENFPQAFVQRSICGHDILENWFVFNMHHTQ